MNTKRALMGLILPAIIGASAAFAQQPTMDKLKWERVIPTPYGSSTGKMQLVEAANKTISGTVVIPGTYNGNPVEVKNFNHCTSITSIVILDGAISISGNSLNGCTSLTSVTIPASVNTFLGSTDLGDLHTKFKAGGAGTYTRARGSKTWTKQGGAVCPTCGKPL
ncbi:MAG: leucine-rich repeat domain-containing protein [Holophagales bacterium]|jgi:hypothetical protein|nr:leucine-rich repeat domain-containing protein [Holophagales bacterium]